MEGAETPQNMQALAKANTVRLGRAERKREIARGELTVVEVIDRIPPEMATMSLSELLRSQKRWGRKRARKFLLGVALKENKQLSTLTPRQRTLLIEELEGNSLASSL